MMASVGEAARKSRHHHLDHAMLKSRVHADGSVADRLRPIALRQIEVGGEIGRRIDITIQNNLLALDIDDGFLRPFREKSRPHGYIGVGKLIDAVVRLAAYSNDERVLALRKQVLDAVIGAQLPDGYIGMLVPEARMWETWDAHEMSYVIYGLVSDYLHFEDRRSLEAARETAHYMIGRWPSRPEGWPTERLHALGFEEALVALSAATGQDSYRRFCLQELRMADWDVDIVLGRCGHPLHGHAYAYLDWCGVQIELYRLLGNEGLLGQTRKAMDFLAAGDGMAIAGSCGQWECWHNDQDGLGQLGETCATAYLIRILSDLLRLDGDSRYGDIMERAIYNALFAAQSPGGRRLRYYTPFEGPRVYFGKDTYCCPGNFRRIIADLPAMVYYLSDGGLAINLYTPSAATFEIGDGLSLQVRQETDYPNSGTVLVALTPSRAAEFPLKLRIPRWCREATITVNDRVEGQGVRGGAFFAIERRWQAGDRVELDMPMQWRAVKGRKSQAGRVAVMRGPVLFCLNRANNRVLAEENLRLVRVDIDSMAGPVKSETVRPNGMMCCARAWHPHSDLEFGGDPAGPTDLDLVLSEFADPGGEATYFRIRRPDAGEVEDELAQVDKGAAPLPGARPGP